MQAFGKQSLLIYNEAGVDFPAYKQLNNLGFNVEYSTSVETSIRHANSRSFTFVLIIPDTSSFTITDSFVQDLQLHTPDTKIIAILDAPTPDVLLHIINNWQVMKIFTFQTLLTDGIDFLNKQEFQNSEHTIERMKFLHDVSRSLSEKKSLSILFDEILESSKLVLNAESSSFMLYSQEDNQLHFHVLGGKVEDRIKNIPLPLGTGISGWVAQNKKSLLIKDCYSDSRFNPEYDKLTNFVTKSMICVPLIRKNRLFGVLSVINRVDGAEFTELDLNLLETLASQCAIAIENSELIRAQINNVALQRELETARSIQQTFLPNVLPRIQDLDISVELIDAMIVGGDYYNIIKLTEHKTLFLVADVSGKSVSAALVVSIIHSCLETYLTNHREEFDIQYFMSVLNSVLLNSLTPDKFVTCWSGLYDSDSHVLTSINAGHTKPIIFRNDGNFEFLSEGGLFMGAFETGFITETVNLSQGDKLYFYTDGITETENGNHLQFGIERLIDTIKSSDEKTSSGYLELIISAINSFRGEAAQSDDITCGVVIIK